MPKLLWRVLCYAVRLVYSTDAVFSEREFVPSFASSLFARAARKEREILFPEFPPLLILLPETGPEYRDFGRRGGRIRRLATGDKPGPISGASSLRSSVFWTRGPAPEAP